MDCERAGVSQAAGSRGGGNALHLEQGALARLWERKSSMAHVNKYNNS